jgi:type IV pilus assembly protein PilA
VKICPYCAEAIPDEAQVCPLCTTNLATQPTSQQAAPAALTGQAQTSGKAIASLICGIFFFVFPSAVVAVVMGHLSLSDIRRGAGRLSGRGMAIGGLVLGYAGVSFIPVLIIAAIAIPNLLRAKIAANEASAVGSLRSYSYAMGFYAAKCPKIGFPDSLANLGPGRGDCDRAQLLDSSLGVAAPVKSGYTFHYRTGTDNLEQKSSFVIAADPVSPGTTGERHFYLDQTGIIRWRSGAPANADCEPLQ